jgi:hypothetical protein
MRGSMGPTASDYQPRCSLGAMQRNRLLAADGSFGDGLVPGQLGGNRRRRICGRLDCPSAIRALPKGYAKWRVFLADAAAALALGPLLREQETRLYRLPSPTSSGGSHPSRTGSETRRARLPPGAGSDQPGRQPGRRRVSLRCRRGNAGQFVGEVLGVVISERHLLPQLDVPNRDLRFMPPPGAAHGGPAISPPDSSPC